MSIATHLDSSVLHEVLALSLSPSSVSYGGVGAALVVVPVAAEGRERGKQLEELMPEENESNPSDKEQISVPKYSNSPERVVEPPVEEGVVAVGAHGEHVAEEEDEVVVVPAAELHGVTHSITKRTTCVVKVSTKFCGSVQDSHILC